MKKKKTLSTILIIIVLIAGISTVVLYKLGDRIFDEVIDMQIIEMEKAMEAADNNSAIVPEGNSQPEAQASIKQGEPNAAVQTTTNVQPTGSVQTPASTQPTAEAQIPAVKPDAAAKPEIQISKDKLEDIKDSVTTTDKMEAATMVLSKLSKSDISHLTQLSAGGITPEEKEEMKAIVYSRFTSEEIAKIKEMYIKYMK